MHRVNVALSMTMSLQQQEVPQHCAGATLDLTPHFQFNITEVNAFPFLGSQYDNFRRHLQRCAALRLMHAECTLSLGTRKAPHIVNASQKLNTKCSPTNPPAPPQPLKNSLLRPLQEHIS